MQSLQRASDPFIRDDWAGLSCALPLLGPPSRGGLASRTVPSAVTAVGHSPMGEIQIPTPAISTPRSVLGARLCLTLCHSVSRSVILSLTHTLSFSDSHSALCHSGSRSVIMSLIHALSFWFTLYRSLTHTLSLCHPGSRSVIISHSESQLTWYAVTEWLEIDSTQQSKWLVRPLPSPRESSAARGRDGSASNLAKKMLRMRALLSGCQ